MSTATTEYTVMENAAPHTCWNDDSWDGTMDPENCRGCAEAAQHPCIFCGYGHVFTTHSEAHVENGDPQAPDFYAEIDTAISRWADSPHIYVTRTIYVVDQQGATFWFNTKQDAEKCLVDEAWRGAVHLSIGEVEIPTAITDEEEISNYAVMHAPDAVCDSDL